MQWLILIGDDSFSLNSVKSIEYKEAKNQYDVPGVNGRFCVDFGTDHIFYDDIQNADEFLEESFDIPYKNPHFITMTYTSKERVRSILQQEDFPDKIYIDNDYGLIMPIKEFIRVGMPMDKEDMPRTSK